MAGNKIVVPNYQRAYSWDTPLKNEDRNTHTDVFLSDLEEHNKSNARSQYYFGHFLFENRNAEDNEFSVIDGQQRLTTIVIFLSALFAKLKTIRDLREDEEDCYEDMVKRRSTIRFSTVDYDDQLFVDYVIGRTNCDHPILNTESQRRIVRAFDFFEEKLADKGEEYLTSMLSIISKSTCSTHQVQDESEAIQMFIFQNNRGKHPSNLEIVKAQFMYNVHLHGGHEKSSLIEEIKNRFETIYSSISLIEYNINEDDVLLYTQRVYFNSLSETNALDRINRKLSEEGALDFIREFTDSLEKSFQYLSKFFDRDQRDCFEIYSLVTLGGIAIAFPFIIKAYKYGLTMNDIKTLCSSLEKLVLRHRLIGTRADMSVRINGKFKEFNESNKCIKPITDRIEWMKTTKEWWWAYWNNEKLKESLQGDIPRPVAKYLLWKYEIHLQQDNPGYLPRRLDDITKDPELEHIAPSTEPQKKPHGYDEYDEKFRNEYLNCLGNYLLVSGSHNSAIGNLPFAKKHKSYGILEQQREIQQLVPDPKNEIWSKEIITKRKEKIIAFIVDNF